MSMLSVRGLTIAMGGKQLIEDASFEIGEGDRIGLVGPNGCGKSSLLRTLVGEHEPEQGEVTRWRGLRPAILHQSLSPQEGEETVREFLLRSLPPADASTLAYTVDVVLDELAVPNDLRERPLAQLSGGWQRIVQIGGLRIADPNLILLDEPTNFLDIEGVIRFQSWLQDMVRCPFLMISHDRELLDTCTNRTFVIHNRALRTIAHPFSEAMAIVQERLLAEEKERGDQAKELQRLTHTYKRLKHWGHTYNVKKLSRRAKSMAKRIERISDSMTVAAPVDKRRIALAGSAVASDFLLRLHDVEVRTPQARPLFKVHELLVFPGDRLVVMGRNGVGKSSFMHLLDRLLRGVGDESVGGSASISPQVRPAYFDQDLRMLPPESSPLDYLERRFGGERTGLVQALIRIGIPYDKVDHPIRTLSGGQRSRLLLLAAELEKPNCYLLDEPTNHLDVEGIEQLEFELASGGATAIIVSHDRRFIAEVGTRFLVIRDGRLAELDDPEPFYASLLESEAPPPARTAAARPAPASGPSPAEPDDEAALRRIVEMETLYPDPASRPRSVQSQLADLYRRLAGAGQ